MKEVTRLNPTAIRVDGYHDVGINVWDFGGDGPPLVLAHCTGTHSRVWDPLVPGLLPYFHVYAYDTRGHGDSDKPEDPASYRWDYSGHDLLAVIDALDLGPGISAVGHSAGGSGICYAEMHRPGAFSQVVLLDPIIGSKEAFSGPNALAAKSRRRRNDFDSFEAAIERYSSRPPLNVWDADALEAYVRFGFFTREDGGVRLKCPGEIEAAVYDGSGATDVFENLGELKFQVTLVTADESDCRRLAEAQRPRYSDVDFIMLEGCGHFIPQERPSEVTALILKALT